MKLGVCYYPEHWPESEWETQAAQMVDMGIAYVRIGEFAWSRLEPQRDRFSWEWLDRAIAVLAAHQLQVVLGTPTATPPKWLLDESPDIVAVGADGRRRGFGSRRHYCFSSRTYRAETARIVTAMAQRYGGNPAIVAWQTDNEFGCHNTTVSYSDEALRAFRLWLEEKYGNVETLNRAWGNVFWSMEYSSFEAVEAPSGTVTESNPSHRLDYRRFASDQVASYNRLQADIIRRYHPDVDIVHNFMGYSTGFDHHKVGRDLDIASWDSYPLGFLEQGRFAAAEKLAFMRQGHPDFAGFHHDLYRGCCNGRWWVMEQQPGPVNWAPNNPAPLPGMVRTWTWEAFAHGAEVVSYFRWRQAPFAQEQMHAGLHLPNGEPDVAAFEAAQVATEIAALDTGADRRSSVALVYSYEAEWIVEIQPQGEALSCYHWTYACYTALRELGLDVDIVSPQASLQEYRMVVVPCLPHADDRFVAELAGLTVPILLGMRTGSKTESFQIPGQLPPGALQTLIPLRIARVESLRPDHAEILTLDGADYRAHYWLEWVETALPALMSTAAGRGVWFKHTTATHPGIHYLATWPEAALLRKVMQAIAVEAGLAVEEVPPGVRLRRRGEVQFAFNYNAHPVTLASREYVLGEALIPAGGVAAWKGR
ncbi:beta-galactosidase [Exilibacterium tricleocarpae]|uniref:Beta-galactosidase n=1 Tax=Exilibacterium tricleocarpae TaxID=2591008 RepID=A0A545SS54_9GAMM|nr:beta-galactosidase [Exilibacterium tricleocarpae]TQV67746.1 beta-galactosidase [Exilibacterium tricleocarpae]